ncbi:MAG: aldo/keto reductase [Candidatus Eisenbacteria bacterium]|nr:aldo/keto reductase [Candidatus Eisenbacteria bacterium]
MKQRELGTSGVHVSLVTLGTWAIGGFMWGGSDERRAIEAIQRSIDLGVTAIDTAPVYGCGLSESIVGKAIAGRRDQVALLTKFGLSWGDPGGWKFWESPGIDGRPVKVYYDTRKATVIRECEASLRRLRTDRIDLYQQHWPDSDTPFEEPMSALEQLLKEGKIRAAGVSNFSADLLAQARARVPIATAQSPYSLLKRTIEKDLVPYCIQHGIAILAYSPLERGLLAGAVSAERVFAATDHRSRLPMFSSENRERVNAALETIRPIAKRHGATLAQAAIHWTIRRPGITTALVGARDAKQAEENAAAAALNFDDAEIEAMTAAMEHLAKR